jgi:outer membrane protein assembly factor BamA
MKLPLPHLPRLAVLLFALVGANWASAQQYPILELRAKGSKLFSDAEVIKATGLRVDTKEEVPLAKVREAAEKLVGSGVFAEVNYRHTELRNGMKVEFTVQDKPADQLVPSRFENFAWWPESQLLAELHARLPLFAGRLPLGGTLSQDVAAELESLLKGRGVKGHVTSKTNTTAADVPEAVEFEVEEWPIVIASVSVAGASADFVPELQKASSHLRGLNYSRSMVDSFAETNLRNLYLSTGHLQARFSPPQVQVIADKESETLVSVSIPVEEGASYALGSIHWTGNRALTNEQLQKYIHAEAGQTLDGVEFAKNVTRLRDDYAIRGYLHMVADVAPHYDNSAHRVFYDMRINEGDLFSMGKFSVDGMTPANAEKVQQLWKMREGDPFNVTYLKQFIGTFHLPDETPYVLEQSEGEAKNSIDVTLLVCQPRTPCRPSGPNALYSSTAVAPIKDGSPAAKPSKETQNTDPHNPK